MSKIDYNACLEEFKKSLVNGSEFDILLKGILKNISTNRIRWFDVGVGNGNYLKKIVDALEKKGFIVEVTGIDANKESLEKAKQRFPRGKFILGDFLDENLYEKYDVFNFNQSLYYFHNKNFVIEKCLKNLSEGGLLIGVCWSKKDKIFQFHQEVFGEYTLGAFTSEDLKNLLGNYSELSLVYDKLFEGKIDFGLWKNEESLMKNLEVISRIPVSSEPIKENYELSKKLIQKKNKKEKRFNGVVIAKKSYSIPNFNRKSIEEQLVKRFPNYKEKIKYIKGDLEALFMGSWEKETEYLSEYVNSGRVLEICCAAGLKSVILGKKHDVVAIDINEDRLNSARENADLFGVKNKIDFKKINAENTKEIEKLGKFDVIYIDIDWRENLNDPIKKQNINPFKTQPPTDKLYKNLRKIHPNTPIIFKISPFVRVKDLKKLDPCLIEELYIDNKFLSYNVYFDPKIKKTRLQEIHLHNKDKI
jgi:SAM-dependent methyltransferase